MPLRLPRRSLARPPRRLFLVARAAVVIGVASAPIAAATLPALAGTTPQSEWWLSKLHVTQAWRTGEGAGVTVAVLADGVDAGQPDLTGRVTSGPDFTRSDRIAGGPRYGVIGTGLASLIAGHGHGPKSASGTYSAGIFGVARAARILAVRVTLSPDDPLWSKSRITSRLTADIADGIRYAVLHNASVILLPADPGLPGISGWGGIRAAAGGSAAERAAIEYAISHNVVLVAPAGDNAQAGDAMNYPAAYHGVIAVGAFGRNFVKAPYSCRRSYVTLTAAGAGVPAAAPSGYQTMNSTWAASAIVAGVAALIRAQFPNPTAAQVTTAMTSGTAYKPPNGLLSGSGHGTVDAQKAILAAATMSPPRARSAFLGALPRRQPVMPHVQSQPSIIAGDLMRDGALSAAVLAALLIPIAWYGSAVRKRGRQAALAAAEWARQDQAPAGRTRSDHGMVADPLLEFFGPQRASPAGPQAARRAAAGPKFQPRPALTGRSTLTSGFAARPMRAAAAGPADASAGMGPSALAAAPVHAGLAEAPPAPAGWPGRGQQASAAAGPAGAGAPAAGVAAGGAHPAPAGAPAEPDAWTTRDAAFRPSEHTPPTLRHAPVSGSPPWGPAPRPTSELPWAVVQGPQAGGGLPPGQAGAGADAAPGGADRQGPPESAWESRPATASSAPRAIFDPGQPHEATEFGPGIREPFQRSTDSGSWPIYVWNPASPAEAPYDAGDDVTYD